jgi:hypothetical protein
MEKYLQVTFQNQKISAVRHAAIVNYNLKFYPFFLMSDKSLRIACLRCRNGRQVARIYSAAATN